MFTFFFWSECFFWQGIAVLLILYTGLLALGSGFIQFDFFLKSINQLSRDGISLTFDDGPDPITTPKILDILKANNVKASFFLIGRKAKDYPDIVKRIQEEGHVIGNHSYSHSNFLPLLPGALLKRDILKCNELLNKLTGSQVTLFRPPFGVTNPNYRRVLRKLRLTSVGWSLRSLDTTAKSAQEVLNKVIPELKNSNIVLLHDTQESTIEALPTIIEECHKNGMAIVSLDL